MARPPGMARAAPQSRFHSSPYHRQADRAGRKRTAEQSALAQRQIARRRKNLMHAPRRKSFNSVNAASLARWIVITGFLALTGLVYVYLTLQLYHLGDRKKALENELTSLHSQNDVASVQIAALTSRAALQRRLKEGYLKMIPIAERDIVRLTVPARQADENVIQPVVNEPATR